MKRIIFILTIGTFILSKSLIAQNEAIVLTIDNKSITLSEFLEVYNKNNTNMHDTSKSALKEYMDLYLNFKLKIKEAEDLGFDTVSSFVSELKMYRGQLAQPYLINEEANESLIKEAFERMQTDIKASHLLIKLDENALPEDTLKAYNKIIKLRNRIIKGEDFAKVTKENSDDLSARDREVNGQIIKGNAGNLGYFTVFEMVYPFETAAYETNIGEISAPMRSKFGYHLIKIEDKKPAMGQVQVAHILLRIPENSTAADSAKVKQKAIEIFDKIENGENFESLAKEYSDDKNTSPRGGILPWFGSSRMIPEFIYQISKLKNKGDVTKPFISSFGWHIVKLIDQKSIGSYKEEYNNLKQRLGRNERANVSKNLLIEQIKGDYNFKEYPSAKSDFYTIVTDTIFTGNWNVENAKELTKTMFIIGDSAYTQQDFANYLNNTQSRSVKENINNYVDNKYKIFTNDKCINYEDKRLEVKYPEFKALVKEYREGILLFNITDSKVWSKAISDTIGLKKFYDKNKNKYRWEDRMLTKIYKFPTNDSIVRMEVLKMVENGISDKKIKSKFNIDSIDVVVISESKFPKNNTTIYNQAKWEIGIYDNVKIDNKPVIIKAVKVCSPENMTFEEAKGLVTSDYQNFLEEEWLKELHAKYKYEINESVLYNKH